MVAAGAGALMAASESGSSKSTDGVASHYENAQRSGESQGRRVVKVEKKNSVRSPIANKTTPIRETKASRLRAASIVSPTDSGPVSRKSTITESLSSSSLQAATSSVRKPKSPMSSSSRLPTCVTRERDKIVKRNSVSIKSPESEEKRQELTSYYENSERTRTRRTTSKQSSSSKTERLADSHENVGISRRVDLQQQCTGSSTSSRASSAIASSSGMKTRASTQRSSSGNSIGHDNSEVLRRVDALTALTRATMERVERLTSNSSPAINGKSRIPEVEHHSSSSSSSVVRDSSGPLKSSKVIDQHEATSSESSSNSRISERDNHNNDDDVDDNDEVDSPEANVAGRKKIRQQPISILKHKNPETLDIGGTSNSIYTTNSGTTSGRSLLIEQLTKKHGILKKRSSLDDNEILRRRHSCSPDTVYPEINGADFKPILKYERRSSLDELIKRSQSPENHQNHQNNQNHYQQQQQQHPTSILKRKSSGEEERDDGIIVSNEPTSILKRTSGSIVKTSSVGHHVSIAAAVAKTLGYTSDITNGTEVRPILKKKFSREESSSSDPPSLEPRPILKKKSSTDSDEHDEKPKTILKSSRKSSQDDSGNEIFDVASPKKLSMLKNRSIQRRTNSLPECDVVRPILKQCSSRESSSPSRSSLSGNASPGDLFNAISKDLFLRKRARSVGHMQSTLNEREDWLNADVNPRRESNNFKIDQIDRNHSQCLIASRSNDATNIAITNTINSATATSSISPIVSFKLPSRQEMEDRYELDDDCSSLGEEGTNPNCSDFRYNFDARFVRDDDDEEEEENNKTRRISNRRRDEWNPRAVHSDSLLSRTQNSHNYVSSSMQTEISKEIRGSNRGTTEINEKRSHIVAENRSNVSRIAQRFKYLAEQVTDSKIERKGSKSNRETRERYDRFNTQPVTYDEVREAVLQNQRKAATKVKIDSRNDSDSEGRSSEIEPSKLSLADRVRLFNQRIATESTTKVGISNNERSQRRRPANRYKTQPVTSEEVEVASRIFPSEGLEQNACETYEKKRRDDSTSSARSSQLVNVAQPRSILKYSTSQTANENRTHQVHDNNRSETEKIGIINEEYLLSADVKLTRKEFTTRRLQRRKRNTDYDIAKEREIGQRLYACNDDDDENFGTNISCLEPDSTEVPCSYDYIEYHDKNDEIRDGIDTADYAETTRDYLLTSKRTRQRASTIEKSNFSVDSDNISYVRRDKLMNDVQQIDFPSISIADRLAALKKSGTNDWKRRVNTESVTVASSNGKIATNETGRDRMSQAERDELATKQRKLAERLEKLETAAEGWRKRVAVPDAVKFSVAGKMRVEQVDMTNELSPLVEVAVNNVNDGKKKIPRPERFRSYKNTKESTSTITMTSRLQERMEIRKVSSESDSEESEDGAKSSIQGAPISLVPRADDETFTSFFSNVSLAKCEDETLDFPESDFDFVTSFSERLGSRRTVKTQRRRLASQNPLRTLAARTDLKDEYTEITTGVAERVMRMLNVEKLAKKSPLAVEALAGLASTEDFGAVTLKNVDAETTGYGNRLPPHKDLMLILVKGRRHVQVRLVAPIAASINTGDNFILVTKNELYNYVGKYSNVIERARGAEIALSIQQNRDLGCRAGNVITVSEEKPTCTSSQIMNFWKILGADTPHRVEVTDAGHPDEDELYESALMDTNMVYEVSGEDELIPIDKYWGAIPKIEMLDPSKILVFDFGSEMYIWNGKIAPPERRKVATHLAEELWQEGYDYTECTVSPINSASIIGRRTKIEKNVKKANTRPEWCLIAKLTQHMETVLFREKFLDWPNVSGIIRVKDSDEKEQVDGKIIVEPPNVDAMVNSKSPVVDLILEGSHLGRGTGWYDDELMRQSLVATTNVTVWHIDEFSYSLLSGSSVGQFYTGDSYIVRWMYTVTLTGRGLSGEPSKHASKGRDRCAYFIWQGQKASLNEQGTAALLTVELDQEQGPQIRVPEGFEPAAFLNLFDGRMVVHNGKKMKNNVTKKWRMYICRGSEATEIFLTEVPCSTRQLRSRGSLLLIDTKSGSIYVWHGRAALPRLKQNALRAANILKTNRPEEAGLAGHANIKILEINESNEEPAALFEALGGMNKQLYVPLQKNTELNHTPRLFHLSSVSGEFAAIELLCPHRADLVTPFPFLQDELYQVNQPALFLLDNKDELWLWQGWWPDSGSEDQTGSGAVRWQAERRAAMIMAIRYWEKLHPGSDDCRVYLVRAGLEPLDFTNLFPTWNYRDEIAELNIRDNRESGEVLMVEDELARLTQSTYPIAQLLQRPLPDGVDPTILEQYLSPQHFEELLGMNIEEFEKLPAWKQINVKKKIGLF